MCLLRCRCVSLISKHCVCSAEQLVLADVKINSYLLFDAGMNDIVQHIMNHDIIQCFVKYQHKLTALSKGWESAMKWVPTLQTPFKVSR